MNEKEIEEQPGKRYQLGYDSVSKKLIWFKNQTSASVTLCPEDYHGLQHRNDSPRVYQHIPPGGYFRWPPLMGWSKCYIREWHFKRVF